MSVFSNKKVNVYLKKEKDPQGHNIFKTRCTINQIVCDLIIDSVSSENIVSKTMVGKM